MGALANVNMTAVIITAIICATIVALAMIGGKKGNGDKK